MRRERFGAAASHALELLSLGDDSTVNRLLLGWSLDRAGNRFLTPGFEVGTRQDPLPIDGSLSGKGDELVLVDGAGRATLYSISGAQAAVVATLGQGDAAVPHRIVRARFAPGLGLLADGQFGPARLWSTPAGVAIAELRPPTGRVPVIGEEFIVVADHRGRRIAGATRRSGGVSLWSVPGMQRTEVRAPDRAGVQRLVFSADDRLLAVLNAAGSISIHDAGTGQQLHSIETGATTIDLQFLPARSELLVLFEKSLELVTLQGSRTALRLNANQGYVQDVAVDAQGEKVAGALSDGTIALWDLGRGAHRAALKDELASTDELTSDLGPPIDLSSYGEGERVTQGMARVAFAGNDALLVGMHTRGRICVWSIETLQTLLCMDGPRGRRLGMRRAAMLDRFLVWGEARQDGGQPRVFDLPITTESQGALRRLVDALPADPMGPQ